MDPTQEEGCAPPFLCPFLLTPYLKEVDHALGGGAQVHVEVVLQKGLPVLGGGHAVFLFVRVKGDGLLWVLRL